MTLQVVNQAIISCSFGTCPTPLKAKPVGFGGDVNVSFNLPAVGGAVNPPDIGASLNVPDVGGSVNPPDIGASLNLPDVGASVNLPPVNGEYLVLNAEGAVAQKLMFVEGKIQGPASIYGKGGQLIQQLEFDQGLLQGSALFYTDGVLTSHISFKDGLRDGLSKFFNPEGKLVAAINFHADLPHGLQTTFDAETGKVLKETLYINGIVEGAEAAGLQAEDAGLQVAAQAEIEGGGALVAGAAAVNGFLEKVQTDVSGALASLSGLATAFNVSGGAFVGSQATATIKAFLPMENIVPFCLCTSPSNPLVAAATAAALGVLTPMPCLPCTLSPWILGSPSVTYGGLTVLTDSSKLMCAFGGVISVVYAGQIKVTLP